MTNTIAKRSETVELARDTLGVARRRAEFLGLSLSEYLQSLIARDAQSEIIDPWLEPVPTQVEERWKQEMAEFEAQEKTSPRPRAKTVAEFRELIEKEAIQSSDDEEL